METSPSYTVFAEFKHRVHAGADLAQAVEAGRRAIAEHGYHTVVIFDDSTGLYTELDPRGTEEDALVALERLAPPQIGPGRPRLGVVSREVSLLPRHWDWLAAQPHGASAAIRLLVDEARKAHPHREQARRAKDVVCRLMGLVCGDQPDYEATLRAVYANRFGEARHCVEGWTCDLAPDVARLIAEAERCWMLAEREAATGAVQGSV